MGYVHPKYRFLAEGLGPMSFMPTRARRISLCYRTHLVHAADISFLRCAESSYGHDPTSQSPFSYICKSPARYDFFLDNIYGPSADQITFWDLTGVGGQFSQYLEGVCLCFP